MNLSTTHVLIIEDEVAIADTLIYACKEAGIATTHYLFGHQALDDLQNNIAQKNNFLTYEIPGQEKARLNAISLNLFDIQGVAQIEFVKNRKTDLIDKMKFTQGSLSIELEKK